MDTISKEDIRKPENIVYKRTELLTDKVMSYCPGCGHGTAHRIIMEVLEEMGIQDKTIGIAPVGCSVLAYEFMNIDMQQAAHGRAPALATAVKRLNPDKFVFTYKGDGDLAAIGTAETIHACNRGENIVIIFINNGIYGMTGGQMAPTTLPGQRTSSSPLGRDVETQGYPIRTAEMLSTLDGASYVVRRSLGDARGIRNAKKAIRTAFEIQKAGLGFSMVEMLSICPTNWGLSTPKSREWLKEHMLPYYPVGDFKVSEEAERIMKEVK